MEAGTKVSRRNPKVAVRENVQRCSCCHGDKIGDATYDAIQSTTGATYVCLVYEKSTLSITPVNELYRDKLKYSVKEQSQLEGLTTGCASTIMVPSAR